MTAEGGLLSAACVVRRGRETGGVPCCSENHAGLCATAHSQEPTPAWPISFNPLSLGDFVCLDMVNGLVPLFLPWSLRWGVGVWPFAGHGRLQRKLQLFFTPKNLHKLAPNLRGFWSPDLDIASLCHPRWPKQRACPCQDTQCTEPRSLSLPSTHMFSTVQDSLHEPELLVSLQTPLFSWQQAYLELSIIGPAAIRG